MKQSGELSGAHGDMCESTAEKRLKDIVFENTKDDKERKILYHYTTPNGFINILKTNSFYASHFKYFNDPSEFIYGLRFINKVIEERLSKEEDQTIVKKLCGLKFNEISELHKEIEQLYALSFSENGDLLSQWQAYAENGKGYSIGIKKEDIFEKTGLNSFDIIDDIYFIKMIYDEEKQTDIANVFYNVLREKILPNNDEDWKKYYYQTLTYIGMIMKHDAYENEKEWLFIYRGSIIFSDEKYLNYREKNNDIIPYVKLYFDENGVRSPKLGISLRTPIPIEKIYIGPTTNTEEIIIGSFLRKVYKEINGYKFPYVIESDCPYRSTK